MIACHAVTERPMALARRYWRKESGETVPVTELLADGRIEVMEIVEEIRKNMPRP